MRTYACAALSIVVASFAVACGSGDNQTTTRTSAAGAAPDSIAAHGADRNDGKDAATPNEVTDAADSLGLVQNGTSIIARQIRKGTNAAVYEVSIAHLNSMLGNDTLSRGWSSLHWLFFNAAASRFCARSGYGSGIGQLTWQPGDYARVLCFHNRNTWNAQLTNPGFDRHDTPCDGVNWGEWNWLWCSSAASRHGKPVPDNVRAPYMIVEHGATRAWFVQPRSGWWFQIDLHTQAWSRFRFNFQPGQFDRSWISWQANAVAESWCNDRGAFGGQVAEWDGRSGSAELVCIFP